MRIAAAACTPAIRHVWRHSTHAVPCLPPLTYVLLRVLADCVHAGQPVLLQHVSSRRCVHPRDGSPQPPDFTALDLITDCSSSAAYRITFKLTSDNLLVHASSGLCAVPLLNPTIDNGLAFPEDYPPILRGGPACDPTGDPVNQHLFVPQAIGASVGTLRHVTTGWCLGLTNFQIPRRPNPRAVYFDCGDSPSNLLFEILPPPGEPTHWCLPG